MFWTLIFFVLIFFGPPFLGPEFYWSQIFFWLTLFWSNFFWHNFSDIFSFLLKILLTPNFFTNIFLDPIFFTQCCFWGAKHISYPKWEAQFQTNEKFNFKVHLTKHCSLTVSAWTKPQLSSSLLYIVQLGLGQSLTLKLLSPTTSTTNHPPTNHTNFLKRLRFYT